MVVELKYGQSGEFTCELDPDRILAVRHAPPELATFRVDLQQALARPLDFPPLAQLFVPGDHVVLALDRHTPRAATLIAEIWNLLEQRGVAAGDVTVLQPAALDFIPLSDPRLELPEQARAEMHWVQHDPTSPEQQAYLASTARGERIYLSRTLVEADVVVSVGSIAFDPVAGYRGTNSVFYPGMSSTEALGKARGLGHSELRPDDERPLRQFIDEVAWLLGAQFTVQVIPAVGGGAAEIIAGALDPVFRRGQQFLTKHWRVPLEQRAEIVVAAIDADAAGHGWQQIGAALATARNLVEKGGKIVLLTDVNAELHAGLELLKEYQSPRDALQPLRKQAPPDLVLATQLAHAADWASIYLLSGMPEDVVEGLFMTALADGREVQRLLATGGSVVFLESAQHTYGEIEAK